MNSTTTEPKLSTKTGDESDYLGLPLTWTATRRFDYGRVYEYRLTLGTGQVAILRLVPEKGWAMTIADDADSVIERGLFATPDDALMVIAAESHSQTA